MDFHKLTVRFPDLGSMRIISLYTNPEGVKLEGGCVFMNLERAEFTQALH